jgi:hypothetical protein
VRIVVAHANNREVHLCLKRLLNIITKHRNITQKLLGTMERQLNTTRAGITRKRRIMLTPPTVTPPTLAITLTTQARLIRRSTAKSNAADSGRRPMSAHRCEKERWRPIGNNCPPAELSSSSRRPRAVGGVQVRPYKRLADAMGPRAFQKCRDRNFGTRCRNEDAPASFPIHGIQTCSQPPVLARRQ